MTLEKWVHDPIILGSDPIFEGSWRPSLAQPEERLGLQLEGEVRPCVRGGRVGGAYVLNKSKLETIQSTHSCRKVRDAESFVP